MTMPVKDWTEDTTVLYEMGKITQNREVILWNKGEKFPKRQLYAGGSKHLKYLVQRVASKKKGMKVCVGSNYLDFKALNPPLLKVVFQSEWWSWKNAVWNRFIGHPDIYTGKNMIWDIDSEGEPMVAFQQAEKLCDYLTRKDYEPMLVFSGSKGFHVWLSVEDSHRLVGKTFTDFLPFDAEKKGTAWKLSQVYNDVVVEVFETATGDSFRLADKSPIQRQGIISCPYSLHWTTGQIVWPLDEQNLNALRALSLDSQPLDIAKALHTQNNGQLWETDIEFNGEKLYFPPCHTVSQRGMPVWKGLDG